MKKRDLINSLREHGFSSDIIRAFEKVNRKDFVPRVLRSRAYEDTALPIGKDQTISQPYTIATMLQELDLKKDQVVLEIGSGSGYVLALIYEITKSKVYGVERIKELADRSIKNLKDYKNIEVINKSGGDQIFEDNTFDRILISAAVRKIPKVLFPELKDNGIIVAPVDYNSIGQKLVALQKHKDRIITKKEIPGFIFVRFVED